MHLYTWPGRSRLIQLSLLGSARQHEGSISRAEQVERADLQHLGRVHDGSGIRRGFVVPARRGLFRQGHQGPLADNGTARLPRRRRLSIDREQTQVCRIEAAQGSVQCVSIRQGL